MGADTGSTLRAFGQQVHRAVAYTGSRLRLLVGSFFVQLVFAGTTLLWQQRQRDAWRSPPFKRGSVEALCLMLVLLPLLLLSLCTHGFLTASRLVPASILQCANTVQRIAERVFAHLSSPC